MTKTVRKLKDQLNRTGKCPVCRSEFIEDLDPRAVALGFKERAKRSRAAKKGWSKRRG